MIKNIQERASFLSPRSATVFWKQPVHKNITENEKAAKEASRYQ